MAPTLTPDFRDIDALLTLIAGEMEGVTYDFILGLSQNYKSIVLGNTSNFSATPNILHVSVNAKETVRDLKDKLNYAVFFITSDQSKDVFEALLPKLEKDKTRTLVLYSLSHWRKYADSILASKRIPSIHYGLVGEVFGKSVAASASNASRIIHTALKQREIVLTGDDLRPLFPVSQSDLLTEIERLVFSDEKMARAYLFWYEHPQTIISAAHILQDTLSDLDVVYGKKQTNESEISQAQIIQDFYAKTHFTPIFMDIALGFKKSVAEITFPKEKRQKRNQRVKFASRKVPNGSTGMLLNALIIGFLLFLILNVFLALAGIFQAKQALHAFGRGEYHDAVHSLRTSQHLLQISEPVISTVLTSATALNIPQLNSSYRSFESGLSIMSLALQTIDQLQEIEQGTDLSNFQEIVANAQHLYFLAQNSPLKAQVSQLAWFQNPTFTKLLNLSPVLSEVLGYTTPKQYLLLFQNNGELRPTGGFIGSIGELTLKNGRVEDLTIRDVYELDGQLKQHIEPPFIVRRYLQPHLYLRDSNFSPNFQEAASSAAQMYKLETGRSVDGVIGVDFTVLQQMITAVGPLRLPNYNKTIDKQNSFSFIQSTIDDNFFPGSTGKRDILNEVFNQLQVSLKETDKEVKVLRLLPDLLTNKHIQIALQDASLQEAFTVNRYGGSLRDTRGESSTEQINDFLSVNEANIGVNKANIALPTRNISYLATLNDKQIDSQVSIRYGNTQQEAKNYKVYLRLIVPQGSELNEVSINGDKQKIRDAITEARVYEAKSFQEPKELEVRTEKIDGKTVFGFPITIPQGKQTTVTVTYHKSFGLPTKSFDYSLLYIPQAGITSTHLTSQIAFPSDFRPQTAAQATYSANKLTISQDIQTDTEYIVQFLKQ